MSNEIIKSNTSVVLDWNDVSSGTYQVQIAKYRDFTTGTEFDGTTTSSTIGHTITGGTGKYYWKWRHDAGAGYDRWREVNSFIYDSAESGDVALSSDMWTFIAKGDVADLFTFEVNPIVWDIEEGQIRSIKRRNIKGKMLERYVATKDMINLDFTQQQYIGTNQKAEFMRFYNKHTSFYVANREDAQDGSNKIYRVWEVLFDAPMNLERFGNLSVALQEI